VNQHPANRLFHALTRITLPTWEQYEAAGEVQKSEIKRQWRNAWRDDDAQKLLMRAARIEREAHIEKLEAERAAQPKPEFVARLSLAEATELLATDRAKYDRYEQWLIAFMGRPWPKKKPDHRDHDREHEIETGEDLSVNPRQSSGGTSWLP
jgi:hypothetical protein